MECRNFLCTAKEPKQFYKFNKSTCKECICARQRLTKKTRENAERSISKSKTKTPVLNSELKTLNSVIASQQKMLEYQQRQTDLIISLTQKLLTSNTEVKERDRVLDESPRKSPLPAIPATPRKYPQFAKYKNRLE